MKHLRTFAALFVWLVFAHAAAAQSWTTVETYPIPAGSGTAYAAGSTLTGSNGWTDPSGNWIDSASAYLSSTANSCESLTCSLKRSDTQSNQQIRVKFTWEGGTTESIQAILRGDAVTNSHGYTNGYVLVVTQSTVGISSSYYGASATTNGATAVIVATAPGSHTMTSGTTYCAVFSAYSPSGSSTTLTVTLYQSDCATQIDTEVATDSTSALQGVAGHVHLGQYSANGANDVRFTELDTYTATSPSLSPATAYTASPNPTSGFTGTAQTYTVTANGSLASAVAVTLAASPDGTVGGSPCTLAANSSSDSACNLTYTPTTAGTKTLTFSNNGGLTNPSATTFAASIQSLIGPSSSAVLPSPFNWYGDLASCPGGVQPYRCASAYWAAWRPGADITVTWSDTAASPVASLILAGNTGSPTISYTLNGVETDQVATSGQTSIALTTASGLKTGANVLKIWISQLGTGALWTGGGCATETADLCFEGLSTDSTATATAQTAPTKTAEIHGDSTCIGYQADGGANNFLKGFGYYLQSSLEASGYGVGVQCQGGYGVDTNSGGSVPALYAVTSGVYSEANSSWDKITAGVSKLDSAGKLSAYGATGQSPSLEYINQGINDSNNADSLTDFQAAVTGLLTAVNGAGASAVYLQPGWALTALTASHTPASYQAAMAAAASADAASWLTYSPISYNLAYQLYQNAQFTADGVGYSNNYHLTALGNALVESATAPGVLAVAAGKMSGGAVTCSGSRSCAVVNGAVISP